MDNVSTYLCFVLDFSTPHLHSTGLFFFRSESLSSDLRVMVSLVVIVSSTSSCTSAWISLFSVLVAGVVYFFDVEVS